MRCANPGPCSSQPQGHKTAFKFQRIRCTICLTSPENQKERIPHLQDVCLPDHMSWRDAMTLQKLLQKRRFLNVRHGFTWKNGALGSLGPREQRDSWKGWQTARLTDCFTLLKRITKLKCVIRNSSQSTLTPTGVASIGPMAPCRSHHRNHTRQEWIIIWSGRNWILKHAD